MAPGVIFLQEERRREWFALLLAAVFEVTWAVAMKYAEGFTRLWPSVITAVGIGGLKLLA